MADSLDINFDPDDMTIEELEEFESISETTLSGMGSKGLSAKTLKAIVYIDQRRKDPDFTLEDAGQVKIGSLNWMGDDDEDEVDGGPSPDSDDEPNDDT